MVFMKIQKNFTQQLYVNDKGSHYDKEYVNDLTLGKKYLFT